MINLNTHSQLIYVDYSGIGNQQKILDQWRNEEGITAAERDERKRVGKLILEKLDPSQPGLYVKGSLNLSYLEALTSLPLDLTVEGDLNLFGCSNLVHLPHLAVTGSLDLSETSIQFVPSDLKVGKSLSLFHCIHLQSLPHGLSVPGSLTLAYCFNLISLPDNLFVGSHLSMNKCTGFRIWPRNITIGGHMDFSGCCNMNSLPDGILNLGLCTNGTRRKIFLDDTGLPELFKAYLSLSGAPNIEFHFHYLVPIEQFLNRLYSS